MKLVSFDVGIRNLAYCVLEGTDRTNVRIVDWNIIDILAEQAGVQVTRCHKCPAAATWMQASTGHCACTRHKPKGGKKLTKKELGTKTVAELQDALKKANVSPVPTKKAECVNLLYTHNRQSVWMRCVKSSNHGSVLDLAPAIMASLDKRQDSWRNADCIVLENQMERRMFAVQAMLEMYFVCRGFKCAGVSATHKLTNIITTDDTVGSYKGRKKTGITHATSLVPEVWKEHLLKHPKKDDLADSFLQGLWALEHAPK